MRARALRARALTLLLLVELIVIVAVVVRLELKGGEGGALQCAPLKSPPESRLQLTASARSTTRCRRGRCGTASLRASLLHAGAAPMLEQLAVLTVLAIGAVAAAVGGATHISSTGVHTVSVQAAVCTAMQYMKVFLSPAK